MTARANLALLLSVNVDSMEVASKRSGFEVHVERTPVLTTEHLSGQWREWRHQRLATLTRPYGWTSLVAQYWLREGESGTTLGTLPGLWSAGEGKIIYTPDSSGENLSVDGRYPTGPVEIVAGRNMVYSNGDSVPVYFGNREVDTVIRTNDDGESIYAVRERDPQQSESTRDEIFTIESFDYDPSWRIPTTFEPRERYDIEASTVETGVRETTSFIGTLSLTIGDKECALEVMGKDSPEGVQPVLQIRDATSGQSTYGAGRVVDLEFVEGDETRIDYVDFNYLAALPCAFTNFVTCPFPPASNRLDVEILAGEKRPRVDVDRILTYSS